MNKEKVLVALGNISKMFFNDKNYMNAGHINRAIDVIEQSEISLPQTNVKVFKEGLQTTAEDDYINTLILSKASDVADKLTQLECKLNGITCYEIETIGGNEISSYTEEAQDIFNVFYDEEVTELYTLLNAQLKIIK